MTLQAQNIFKHIILVLLIGTWALLPYRGHCEDFDSEKIEKAKAAIVMVLSFNASNGKHGQATGFFVGNNGEIITNNHVATGANQILIKTHDNKIYPVSGIVSRDVKSDLIKLAVTMPHAPNYSLPISSTLPRKKDSIVIIGNPNGKEWVVSKGTITSLYQVPNFGQLLHTNAIISQGSSGSPVINRKGEVVGVVSFQFGTTGKSNFAIPASKISAMTSTEVLSELDKDSDKITHADLMEQGYQALDNKDFQKALSIFSFLLATDNEKAVEWRDWELWFYIGRCHGGLGRHKEASNAFEKAIQLMPDNAESHYSLAVAYSYQGLLKEARRSYTEAIRLKPNFAKAHFNLALTCRAQQDSACFMIELAKLNTINPTLADELSAYTFGTNEQQKKNLSK